MPAARPPLPRLAFGNSSAQVSDDLDAFTAAQKAAMPEIRHYEPLRRRGSFLHRSASVRLGDVKIVASAATPLSMAADDSTDATLLLPVHGWSTSVIEGRTYRWQAGTSAMFVPGAARSGESGVRSKLAISFDPRQLEVFARAMLGPRDDGPTDLGLGTPRLIPIAGSRSPVQTLLKHVLPQIDLVGGDETRLRMLGLDSTILRVVALLLAPETIGRSFAAPRSSPSSAAVRTVTEYIVGHLDEPISLSELERVSGLASRTLQVAFRKAHDCSPREWIQRRRLGLARERLLAATPRDTVVAIATACGFTRMSTFTTAYARRFGELPSATLARGRRR